MHSTGSLGLHLNAVVGGGLRVVQDKQQLTGVTRHRGARGYTEHVQVHPGISLADP